MRYPLVATIDGVFAYMQRCIVRDDLYRHITPYVKQNFPLLRVQAEKLARFTCACNDMKDMTLQLVYEALAMTGEIDFDTARLLMELEKRVREELGVTEYGFASENKEEIEDRNVISKDLQKEAFRKLLTYTYFDKTDMVMRMKFCF